MRSRTLPTAINHGEHLAPTNVAVARMSLFSRAGVQSILVLLAPMVLLVLFKQLFAQTDPDYWWHLRTGQYVFETGTVPHVDIYSFTAAGRPWIAHEWLTELLFYLVQRQLGYVGNVVLFGILSVLTWLVVYLTCRRQGLGELGAAMLMAWGYAMAMGSTNVRPQALTALLLAIVVLLITYYRQRRDSRALFPLPLLMALWVNLHAGYVAGLLILGLTVAGEALALALRRPAAPLRPLILATGLSAAATLLNPNGIDAWLYPFTYAGASNASMQYIVEWQSPNFHLLLPLVFAASLLMAVVLGVGRRPLGLVDMLWVLAFGLMALQSTRHIPLYAVVVIPLLAARLQAELPQLRHSLPAGRHSVALGGIWLAVIAVVLGTFMSADQRSLMQLSKEPSAATYPVGAVAYLQTHDLQGNLFNYYGWGGYLVYQLHPQHLVFIDGRADVYGDALVEKYVAVDRLEPGWRQVLDRDDIRLVLVEKESALAAVLANDGSWREAYTGEVEKLFVRWDSGEDAQPGR